VGSSLVGAWHDGLFQICMVAKPTSVWIGARPIVRKGQPA
jgi:hypothetical protein